MFHLSLQTLQLLQGAGRCFVGSGAWDEPGLVRWLQGWDLAEQIIPSVLHTMGWIPMLFLLNMKFYTCLVRWFAMSPLPLLTLIFTGWTINTIRIQKKYSLCCGTSVADTLNTLLRHKLQYWQWYYLQNKKLPDRAFPPKALNRRFWSSVLKHIFQYNLFALGC